MRLRETDALIVVDVQNDFCPGGALAVDGGDEVVPIINQLLERFAFRYFTRDWHPLTHCSFSKSPKFVDGSWPVHAVQNTPGAAFHAELLVPVAATVISKGVHPDEENYSGFHDSDLDERLEEDGVARVFVVGLATDYCVKSTALDARKNGFDTVIIVDACRGVDNPAGTVETALEELGAGGVALCLSEELLT